MGTGLWRSCTFPRRLVHVLTARKNVDSLVDLFSSVEGRWLWVDRGGLVVRYLCMEELTMMNGGVKGRYLAFLRCYLFTLRG